MSGKGIKLPIPGRTDGQAPASGMVGERISSASVETVGSSSTGLTMGTLNLTAGRWQIFVNTTMISSSGTITWARQCTALTTNNALNPSLNAFYSTDIQTGYTGGMANPGPSNDVSQSWSNTTTIDLSTATTYYLRTAYSVNGGGSVGVRNIAYAIRIA